MKGTVLRSLHHAGFFWALRNLKRDSAVVACYHGVMPGDDDSYDFLLANFVAAAAFERQLRWLKSRYTLVPLRQIVDAIGGRAPMPPRAATVTFDDGFANNYRVAFPILKRLGVPATVFLTTEKIGVPRAQLWTERVKRSIYLSRATAVTLSFDETRTYDLRDRASRERIARELLARLKRMPVEERDRWLEEIEYRFEGPELSDDDAMRYDFLTWDEVREMAEAGIEFGSHSVSHPILTCVDDQRLEREVTESKRTIEHQLGRECYAFAYPNGGPGDIGEREMTALERAGYECALSLQGGLIGPGSHRFALDRVNIGREFHDWLLNARLSGALRALRTVGDLF